MSFPLLQAETVPTPIAVPTEPATAQAAAVLLDVQHLAMLLMVVGLLIGGLRGRWKQRNDQQGVPSSAFHFADLFIVAAILGFYYLIIAATTHGQMSPPDPVEIPAVEAPGDSNAIGNFVFSVIFHGFCLGMIFLMIRLGQVAPTQRTASEMFGLKRLGPVAIILWSLGGALVATPMVLSLMEPVKSWLLPLFGELGEQGPVEQFREAAGLNLPTILLVISAVVIAPIAEEVIFRGYLYGVLKRFSDPMTACLIASLFFVAAHINLPALLPLMFLAIFLTLIYEATRCLWVTIGVHALFNATNVAVLLFGTEAPQ